MKSRCFDLPLALAAILLSPPSLFGQGVAGVVSLPDSTPVSGSAVELHRVTADAGALVDSARTDRAGRFRFSVDIAADSAAVYMAAARHDGILYWGLPWHGGWDAASGEEYRITVFDTTVVAQPATDLAIGLRHAILTPLTNDDLQVDEVIDVVGRERNTVVAEPDTFPVWSAPVADRAQDVAPTSGGPVASRIEVHGGEVGWRAAVRPSGARLAVRYFIPSGEYRLSIAHSTRRLEVLVVDAPGLEVTSVGLEEVPVAEGMELSVRRFAGSDLEAGTLVSVRVGRAAPRWHSARMWLVLAVAFGIAAAFAARLGGRGPGVSRG